MTDEPLDPPDAGTITMHMKQIWMDVDSPPRPGRYVMSVIRGSGPREGERMGWALVTVADDGDDVGFKIFPTREEAVRAWHGSETPTQQPPGWAVTEAAEQLFLDPRNLSEDDWQRVAALAWEIATNDDDAP